MSKGRQRFYWGPFISRDRLLEWPEILRDISFRCTSMALFCVGTYVISVAFSELFGKSWRVLSIMSVVGFSMGCTYCCILLLGYRRSTMWHFKRQQGDRWLYAMQEHRVEWLSQREQLLLGSIAALCEDFEKEKVKLEEIREERMAQERATGYLRGLQEAPAMVAYHANPRNRLRAVPGSGEESA